MLVLNQKIYVNTTKQFQIYRVTDQIEQLLAESKIKEGVCNVFVPHSTAGVKINDHEALLHQDVMKMFYRIAPSDINYGHDSFEIRSNIEPDERSNGHAHAKAFIVGSSESIPVMEGRLVLGKHQEVFLLEFDGPRKRSLILNFIGNE